MRRFLTILMCLLASLAGAQQGGTIGVPDSQNALWDANALWPTLARVQSVVVTESTYIWYGTIDVAWTNKSNWTNTLTGANEEPSTNDTVIFNNAGNGKINIGYDGGFRAVKNIIATNSAMAVYTLGSNTTELINWTPDGSITMYGNAGNNLGMQGNIHVGSTAGEVTNYITCYSKTRAISFSQGSSQLEATNGNVVLVFNTVSNNGTTASINMAGQWKKTSGNITKVIKQGVGLVNVGSGTPGNTTISDYYLNEGALSFVGDQPNLINGNRLFINTNTHLICANRPNGNFTGITNYWNGDFSFGSSGYGAAINQMTFQASCLVDLGQYGSDAVRTISVSNGTLTVNCKIVNGSNGTTTGLAKRGTALLVLGGTNEYTGATYVLSGTLQTTKTNTILASTAVYVTNSAVLNLDFTGTNQIDKLYLAGTSVVSAVYGATSIPGTNLITGTGFLSVTNGP